MKDLVLADSTMDHYVGCHIVYRIHIVQVPDKFKGWLCDTKRKG